MKILLLFVSLLLSAISSQSFADATLSAQLIYAIDSDWAEQGFKFSFDNGQKLQGCNSSSVFVKNSSMSKRILNIALAAHYAKKPVVFRVQGCVYGSMKGIAIHLPD
ncbi:MAG: hypothetical protein OFPI_27210 [Osedax symbiont Rs2]|nr:MAG: hypothetical protein OFPI_27210 [Osedax symbiont Rs2]